MGLAAATGADLCWRARNNLVFTPLEQLPDGSCISVMPTPAESRRHGTARAQGRVLPGPPAGHRVRVIDYAVTVTSDDGTARTEAFRLVTTLLDWREAPAGELAALYHQRWESEGGYGELKTRLRGAGFTLRSRTPDLACQEMLAFLVIYQALCAIRQQAAGHAGIDPDRLSFTVTIRIARDHARDWHPGPAALARARAHAITDMLADLLPPRRSRQCERDKKRPRNTCPARKTGQPRAPANVTYRIHVTPKTAQPAQPP